MNFNIKKADYRRVFPSPIFFQGILWLKCDMKLNLQKLQELDNRILHHIWTPEVDLLHAKATTQNKGIVFTDQKTNAYVNNGEVTEI